MCIKYIIYIRHVCTYTIHRASENLRTTRVTVSRKKRCAIKRNYRILLSSASPVTVTIESLESPLRFTENRFYSFPSPFPFFCPSSPPSRRRTRRRRWISRSSSRINMQGTTRVSEATSAFESNPLRHIVRRHPPPFLFPSRPTPFAPVLCSGY